MSPAKDLGEKPILKCVVGLGISMEWVSAIGVMGQWDILVEPDPAWTMKCLHQETWRCVIRGCLHQEEIAPP
jgi:hypothetical protein